MSVPKILVATEDDLKLLIEQAMDEHGPQCDLNHLDVSRIQSFDGLFMHSEFNGDISDWDVSGATSMAHMFSSSSFNGDISRWNVSRVENMSRMFKDSVFNGDISGWRPHLLYKAPSMFENSAFSGDVSNWCPPDMTMADGMFATTAFHGDLSKWTLRTYCQNNAMVLPSFNGVLPNVEWSNHYSDYTVLIGGIEPLHEHLRRTPFSHTHADLLVWGNSLCEEWASDSMLLWAREQIKVGDALGLGVEGTRHLMLDTYHARTDMEASLPGNAFDA